MLLTRSSAALKRAAPLQQHAVMSARAFSDFQELEPQPRYNRGPRQPRALDGARYGQARSGESGRYPPKERSERRDAGQMGSRPRFNAGPAAGSYGGGFGGGRQTEPTTLGALQSDRPTTPPHLLTLADLSPAQIAGLLRTSLVFKLLERPGVGATKQGAIRRSLQGKTTALIFSKRSTRTRVASETSMSALGGNAMFLGREDIQLGVNETLEDSAKVIGSMVDGIMARVGPHAEVEALVNGSGKPVINALSDLYHPTQILADLLTIYENYAPDVARTLDALLIDPSRPQQSLARAVERIDILAPLKGLKVAWVGDTNNVLHDMLVAYPRLGMTISVASPKGYDKVDERVWKRVEEGGHADKVILTNSPEEALKDADIAVTDTWISMGQEAEKQTRLSAFAGYQITEELCARAGAKPDWRFMHCLPRKQEEVDDDVFYGKRSIVFPEAQNRKYTIMACFDHLIGQWKI